MSAVEWFVMSSLTLRNNFLTPKEVELLSSLEDSLSETPDCLSEEQAEYLRELLRRRKEFVRSALDNQRIIARWYDDHGTREQAYRTLDEEFSAKTA